MKNHELKYVIAFCMLITLFIITPPASALSCGDSVVSSVVLTEDLDCSSGYTALEISNHNVTIDLNGFVLSGSSSLAGITVHQYHNLVIKNGSIRGFWAGVNGARTENMNVSDVVFYEVGHGVILSTGNNARISRNDFINTSSSAISISVRTKGYSANRNVISQNEFYRTNGGISICGAPAEKNVIADNLIWKSGDYGIHLNHSNRNQIYRNRILDSSDLSALRLDDSSYNVINQNTFQEGDHTGISVLSKAATACLETDLNRSVKNQITNNRISNFATGILMGLGGFGSPSNIEGNRIFNNQLTANSLGILLQSDTLNNYGSENDFTDTTTPLRDYGVRNRF